MSTYSPRDLLLARRAKRYGMKNSLRIVLEARRAGLPVSLAFALVEQESTNGANVWGHDPAPNGHTSSLGGKPVTRATYLSYRDVRGPSGRGGMQGVGPLQLTWWEFQDIADSYGGCWVPKHNLRVGFGVLAKLIKTYGKYNGIARYNGSGAAAQRYASSVLDKQDTWHRRLTEGER